MTIEAMKQALEALEDVPYMSNKDDYERFEKAQAALRQAIEQAEKQEPVAYINVEQRKLEWAKYTKWDTPTVVNLPKIPLYTTPQPQPCPYIRSTREGTHHCALSQREWVGLTLEDKKEYLAQDFGGSRADAMDWADKRLKEKNT